MPIIDKSLSILIENRLRVYNEYHIFPTSSELNPAKKHYKWTYGLFKPLHSPHEAFHHGLYCPLGMVVIDLLFIASYCLLAPLYIGFSLVSLLGFRDIEQASEDFYFAYLAVLGIPYMAVHTIIDPLWECLSFLTRMGATLVYKPPSQSKLAFDALDEAFTYDYDTNNNDEESEPLLNRTDSMTFTE